MTATEINNTLIDSYLKLLSGLTERNKKLLIEKLKASKKKKVSNNSFLSAFGAWESDESAEEIIEKIQEARTINHEREAW